MDSSFLPTPLQGLASQSVPRDGRKVLDKLRVESTDELFLVPDTIDFAARHGYVATQELQEMFVNYREDIIKKFTYLYTSVSDAFTIIDDYMIFYRGNFWYHKPFFLLRIIRC